MIRSKIAELRDEKARRERRKLTYKVMSEESQISQTALVRLVSGEFDRLDLATLNSLCRYFECGVGDVLEFVPPAPANETDGTLSTEGLMRQVQEMTKALVEKRRRDYEADATAHVVKVMQRNPVFAEALAHWFVTTTVSPATLQSFSGNGPVIDFTSLPREEIPSSDLVIDPAAGSAGFLLSSIENADHQGSRADVHSPSTAMSREGDDRTDATPDDNVINTLAPGKR